MARTKRAVDPKVVELESSEVVTSTSPKTKVTLGKRLDVVMSSLFEKQEEVEKQTRILNDYIAGLAARKLSDATRDELLASYQEQKESLQQELKALCEENAETVATTVFLHFKLPV